MTRPTLIYFNADHSDDSANPYVPKVFLRTLLFSTSKRGRIIESLYVTVTKEGARQSFNVWVYGERDKLVRGSGLFVGDTGVEANHHFLPPPAATASLFDEGVYRVEVYAHLLGDKRQKLLLSQSLEIKPEFAHQLQEPGAGLRFDWAPDLSRWSGPLNPRTQSPT
ncbi:hypothetical protein [Ralstonia syzygii]|nr:hypothetical protein [Ralstonia syzygii]CCA79827.1 conserved hypothetical protein (modular protein) [blood disease bacterium R229]